MSGGVIVHSVFRESTREPVSRFRPTSPRSFSVPTETTPDWPDVTHRLCRILIAFVRSYRTVWKVDVVFEPAASTFRYEMMYRRFGADPAVNSSTVPPRLWSRLIAQPAIIACGAVALGIARPGGVELACGSNEMKPSAMTRARE